LPIYLLAGTPILSKPCVRAATASMRVFAARSRAPTRSLAGAVAAPPNTDAMPALRAHSIRDNLCAPDRSSGPPDLDKTAGNRLAQTFGPGSSKCKL
jgi:hypothetical protein